MLLNKSITNVAVYIGRFQPLHKGHLSVIQKGLELADHLVIAVGSARSPRAQYNPFTLNERRHMIESCLTEDQLKRVVFVSIGDHLYNDPAWVEEVQREVLRVSRLLHGENPSIRLIGMKKDVHTGYYLRMFPDWDSIDAENFENLSATPMRDLFFTTNSTWLRNNASNVVPEGMMSFLTNFAKSQYYEELVKEFSFNREYPKKWGYGPFVTTDACVFQSNHVLMIRRKGRPGKGLLAMPGGFLEVKRNETLQQCMLRELDEEANLDVPPAILKGNIIRTEAFDAPFRDPRARIITHGFLINLPRNKTLPKVTGGSDAEFPEFVSFGDLKEEECYADHYHIIKRLRGFLPKNDDSV